MKKESIYLPTLNSLFMQDIHYRKHLLSLRNCKSSFDNYSTALTINNRDLQPIEVKILKTDKDQSPIRKIKSKVLLRYHSTENSQRDKNLAPYEKRKLCERNNQNLRIYQILKASKCSGYRPNKNNIDNYEELRGRISKFIREGNSIKYKFKRSLREIEKRKGSSKNNISQNLRLSVVEQARKILSNSRNKKVQKDQMSRYNDIYLQTMKSNMKNDANRRQSQKSQIQKSQSMSIIQQNTYPIEKKDSNRQKNCSQQSFINGLPKTKTQQHINYTMDYISQLKIKKKEKYMQKVIMPKSVALKQQKSTPNDLLVVEIQPKLSKNNLS